jgi:hypothetical protein
VPAITKKSIFSRTGKVGNMRRVPGGTSNVQFLDLGSTNKGVSFFFFFLLPYWHISFFYSFIHMCIHCLGHFFPLPPASHHHHPHFQAEPVQVCWRVDISNNKKDIAFLLVWDKDSYTERFLALLPCIGVLQPKLINLYLTSSLLPGHLPILSL